VSDNRQNTNEFPISRLDYHLPSDMIAQKPLEKRDESKLLVCNRSSGTIEHRIFKELPELLPPGSIIVINTSRVFPARVKGVKETGGAVELLFLREIEQGKWRAIFSRRGRMPEGRRILLFDGRVVATLIERIDDGNDILEIDNPELFKRLLDEEGMTPLPPYITERDIDPSRYQTVYAENPGSSAAPTAGLHFTNELIIKMESRGFKFVRTELQIGLDTFSPIRTENLRSHKIHTERGIISEAAALMIKHSRSEGKKIVAVGTTSTRLLEHVASKYGEIRSFDNDVDLFIVPGYEFKIVDILITNFHLPRTTLLALVGAFMGVDFMFEAYEKAIENKYRFYSFGDAMLIV